MIVDEKNIIDSYYKCLPWHAILATIFFMLAISAVVIPTLLAVFIKTNYFSSTNNTKCKILVFFGLKSKSQ